MDTKEQDKQVEALEALELPAGFAYEAPTLQMFSFESILGNGISGCDIPDGKTYGDGEGGWSEEP